MQSTDQLRAVPLELSEVLLLEPRVFADARGYFFECFSTQRCLELGLPAFVQDNVSFSRAGCLRGLHLQHPKAQGKLVMALKGSILDVAVDLRVDSPTFKRWVSAELSDANHRQLYVPPGFAHGFCVLGAEALVQYKCSAYYAPSDELGVRYDDPELGIAWPVHSPLVSARDAALPQLAAIARDKLPRLGV